MSTFHSLKVNFQSEDITPSFYSIYKTAELQLRPRHKIKAEEVNSPSPNKSALITRTDASHLHCGSHAHNRSLRQRNGISLSYPWSLSFKGSPARAGTKSEPHVTQRYSKAVSQMQTQSAELPSEGTRCYQHLGAHSAHFTKQEAANLGVSPKIFRLGLETSSQSQTA